MIVVTGATGLLGGHLLLELITSDEKIRALIRPGSNPEKVLSVWRYCHPEPAKLLDKIEWVEADLIDQSHLEELIGKNDRVYHCAGVVSFNRRDMEAVYDTNVRATSLLVNTALKNEVAKLVHVSSIATIGTEGNGELQDENMPVPAPAKKSYGSSKVLGELEVWRGIAEGLNAVIVNPSVILGAGNWQQSSARIFDTIFRGLSYFTRGTTGYVDVMDVARIMVMLMKSDISGERYILNADNVSFEYLFNKIAEALGVNAPAKYASKWMTQAGFRFEGIRTAITGKEPRLTRQTSKSAHARKQYTAEKVRSALNVGFTPIEETINRVAGNYLENIR